MFKNKNMLLLKKLYFSLLPVVALQTTALKMNEKFNKMQNIHYGDMGTALTFAIVFPVTYPYMFVVEELKREMPPPPQPNSGVPVCMTYFTP